MKIQVTQEDVQKALDYQNAEGLRDYCCHCPVANALERQTGKQWKVYNPYFLCVDGRKVNTPEHVLKLINHFDSACEMPDFEFELPDD